MQTNQNWKNGVNNEVFYDNDTVTFNDSNGGIASAASSLCERRRPTSVNDATESVTPPIVDVGISVPHPQV